MLESTARGAEPATSQTSFRIELADGTDFTCGADETILHAALRAGLDVPYECASGSCGSCKCRLKSGSVRARWSEAPGLSERDRRKGDRILGCQSVPDSDLVLGLRARAELNEPAPASQMATIDTVERLNPSVSRLLLTLAQPAPFLPGQFYLLDIPGAGRRAYSMANLPRTDGQLELLVKRKPDGAGTTHLFENTEPGDRMRVEGPYGRGYLRTGSTRPLVAVAGGSGLAPMLSVVRGALEEASTHRRIELWFGVDRPRDVFCLDALSDLEATGRVRTHLVLREGALSIDHPRPHEGLVGPAMVAAQPRLSEADLYLAGPTPMVDDLLGRTVRPGLIDASRVFFDRFC